MTAVHPQELVSQRRLPVDPEVTRKRPGLAAAVLAIFLLTAISWVYFSIQESHASVEPTRQLPDSGDDRTFRSELFHLSNDSLAGFVEIPGGPFLMGSDPTTDRMAFENEFWQEGGGQGMVDIPRFFIGRYEVTTSQFNDFLGATGRVAADSLSSSAAGSIPATFVSWPDAIAYARWLESQLLSSPETPAALRDLLGQGWKLGLPTEAQWEKAARSTDGRIYPWGNEPRRDLANYLTAAPRPVGSIPCPSCAYGLSDMSGNVWEWTRSPYRPLPFDPNDDTVDLASDALWVMRGGAFSDNDQLVRAATRGGADPGARRAFIGFRLVLSHD